MKFFGLLLFLLISGRVFTQVTPEDLELLEPSFSDTEQSVSFLETEGKSFLVKPVIWFGGAFLYLYQSHLTHQLPSQCPYVPSCSHFAKEAINTHGFLKGIVLGADRLMRCLPNAENDVPHFKVDFVTRRISDHPEEY